MSRAIQQHAIDPLTPGESPEITRARQLSMSGLTRLMADLDSIPDECPCPKCGGTMLAWDSSRIYRDAPQRIVYRCVTCGEEKTLPKAKSVMQSADEVQATINEHFADSIPDADRSAEVADELHEHDAGGMA